MNAHIVLCTCPTVHVARRLARTVVEARVAACVNIIPQIESIYIWNGKMKTEQEVQMIIKTSSEAYPALEAVLLRDHPYDRPEILAISSETGSDAYLNWVTQQCAPGIE